MGAGERSREAQQRDVEDRRETADAVEDGRGGAAERGVGVAEMVVLMNGDRLLRDDAGADAAGAGEVLGPVRPEIEPGRSEIVDEQVVPEEIDANPLRVGQKQHVVLARDLPEQALQARTRRADHPLRLLSIIAQLGLGDDGGGIVARRVHAVELDASPPGCGNEGVAPCLGAIQNPLDFRNVPVICHAVSPPGNED